MHELIRILKISDMLYVCIIIWIKISVCVCVYVSERVRLFVSRCACVCVSCVHVSEYLTCVSEFSRRVSRVFSSRAFSFIRSVLRDSELRRVSLSAANSLFSCSSCPHTHAHAHTRTHTHTHTHTRKCFMTFSGLKELMTELLIKWNCICIALNHHYSLKGLNRPNIYAPSDPLQITKVFNLSDLKGSSSTPDLFYWKRAWMVPSNYNFTIYFHFTFSLEFSIMCFEGNSDITAVGEHLSLPLDVHHETTAHFK